MAVSNAIESGPRAWPRRLLHVPSMTSHERSNEGFYGDLYEPAFNAISYTWGRYAIKHGPSINIRGISWEMPSIYPNHFTVDSFYKVLQAAASPNGLVWVDVACIDQKNPNVKMDEIGKQADIFSRASNVFIWLSSLANAQVTMSVQALQDFAERLEHAEIGDHSFDFANRNFVEVVLSEATLLRNNLLCLFGDPWFSSLWTLQEASLCEHAYLLSKEARRIAIGRPHDRLKRDAVLRGPIDDCHTIKMSLSAYAEQHEIVKNLIAILDKSGLGYLHRGFDGDASSMLLYSAAHYRTCSEPLDRIYGIMQAFRFKLGASREPGRYFTLFDLEDQFGEALNAVSPMAAQIQVHTTLPAPGSAWRPTTSSMLPDVYYMASYLVPICSITREKRIPVFNGKACSLEDLRCFWAQCNFQNESAYHVIDSETWHWQHYIINIHLDASQERAGSSPTAVLPQFQNAREPGSSCPCSTCSQKPERQKDGLDQFLDALPRLKQDYAILLLGSGTVTQFIKGNQLSIGKYLPSSHTIRAQFGILVVKPSIGGDSKTWGRVGIVSWEAAYGDFVAMHESLFKEFRCEFG